MNSALKSKLQGDAHNLELLTILVTNSTVSHMYIPEWLGRDIATDRVKHYPRFSNKNFDLLIEESPMSLEKTSTKRSKCSENKA